MAKGPIYYRGGNSVPSNARAYGRLGEWDKTGNTPVNRGQLIGRPVNDAHEIQIWTDTYTLGEESNANANPVFFSAQNNPAELVRIAERISNQNFNTVQDATNWLNLQSNISLVNEGIVLDGLMMHFEADEWNGTDSIILDASGNNNNGTPLDGMVKHANGFLFDGTGETDGSPTGSYIGVNMEMTSTLNRERTYDFWMYPLATGRRSLFFGSGSIKHIEIYNGSGSFRTEASTQNGYSFGASGGNNVSEDFGPNKWTHITISFAADGAVRWYANGKLFYTGNMFGGTGGVNEYFAFSGIGRATGTSAYLYAQSFHGYMDGIKIYDRAITGAEALKNFNASSSKFGL